MTGRTSALSAALVLALCVSLSSAISVPGRPVLLSGNNGRSCPETLRLRGGCGFLGVYGSVLEPLSLRFKMMKLARMIRHRGPDGGGVHIAESDSTGQRTHGIAHERLAIVGVQDDPEAIAQAQFEGDTHKLHTLSGNQPLYSHDRTKVLSINGEIYNYKALMKTVKSTEPFRTASDCEVVIHLYDEIGEKVASQLDGDFAFVILDEKKDEIYAARDPVGVASMYIGWGSDGSVWFASEMKCLLQDCLRVEQFPPGHFWTSKTRKFTKYYNPPWVDAALATAPADLKKLKVDFEAAVAKRLMTDVPYGVLLSGGLDSSLVASVVVKMCKEHKRPLPSTFSIGLQGSPDLLNARKVAKELGTDHHEFYFTVQEGIDAVQDVIYHLETYDVTTIRAGTPMFILARKIKALGVKMVISGEGADEEFGGYLYFHKAPNGQELHEECVRKIHDLHKFDCLRANKATMAWGVEARVPFLDKEFLNTAMEIDGKYKMVIKGGETQHIEKWMVREAFNCEGSDGKPYLPQEVLFRQKEQFSDGVGYDWIDGLKAHTSKVVDDYMFSIRQERFPYNPPGTKEAYYARMIFEQFFPSATAAQTVPTGPSVACSTAKAVEWDSAWKAAAESGSMLDQSGRSVAGVHNDHKAAF
eukprot:CAMPEP_0206227902 /NCGR_PEP_ID=MMETSP0047_2-20121206/8877_1 /ASSEMBLY_ACC=CAM_ASM_000192 /TAXON_ID=195065 /ORGANISM="Chroomonas mesostigmatica_cf, Strain CCMP1168" /LENGTH=641 /DNA_ID=CAMNT_0053651097 /DNA_START=79 /DNA_END=2004 /DNA_ORIENTATION=-